MKNIFLTGEIQIGKTTLLNKIIEMINLSIGGFQVDRTIEQGENSSKKEFYITSLINGVDTYKIATITSENNCFNTTPYADAFNTAADKIILESLKCRDVIVLDELGFLESKAEKFQNAVFEALNSDKLVLGVIKPRPIPFLDKIRNRDDVIVIEVTKENRDKLLESIISIIEKEDSNIIRKYYFSSNLKRITWYDKALNYSECEYPRVFLDKIKDITINDNIESALDIGSGTGAFTIPLSKHLKKVTSLDFSINMINYLKNKCKKENRTNIEYILSPFEKLNINKHDIVINAFSSGVTKNFNTLKKLCNVATKYAFIISHHESDTFKFGSNELSERLGRTLYSKRKGNNEDLKVMLNKLGVEYSITEVNFNFPQYFEDRLDAINFFTVYFNIIDEEEINIIVKYLDEVLLKREDGYIYPENRLSRFIVIKK